MSLRQSLIGLLWTLGLANRPNRSVATATFTDEELTEIHTREELDRTRLLCRKGMAEWTIDGYTVWARDGLS